MSMEHVMAVHDGTLEAQLFHHRSSPSPSFLSIACLPTRHLIACLLVPLHASVCRGSLASPHSQPPVPGCSRAAAGEMRATADPLNVHLLLRVFPSLLQRVVTFPLLLYARFCSEVSACDPLAAIGASCHMLPVTMYPPLGFELTRAVP